jgi:hypothetical protein
MILKYPEIFDISDIDAWIKTFVRKELLTSEWDLISKEISTDIFEIPFFTTELCDKLVENMKQEKGKKANVWGHECEEMDVPESIEEAVKNLFLNKLVYLFYHHWSMELSTFQKLQLNQYINRFRKNQDLRVRHDGSMITCYIKLDSDSTGGELYFPKYDFQIEPKQGHLYFFPGRITHRYGKNFVKSGINNSLYLFISDHGQTLS